MMAQHKTINDFNYAISRVAYLVGDMKCLVENAYGKVYNDDQNHDLNKDEMRAEIVDELIKSLKDYLGVTFDLRPFAEAMIRHHEDENADAPWCHICGAERRKDCDCGPRAEND